MSFTLTPFLYQTRTILRMPTTQRASARIVRSLHVTSRCPKDIKIPFDYEVGPPDKNKKVAAVRGTITPTERQIFERIFADIEARGLKPAATDGGVPTPEQASDRSTRLIMQQAAYDAGQSRPPTVASPALLSGAAKDRAKALLRFPPALRAAASKVLDAIKDEAIIENSHDDARRTDADDELAGDDLEAPSQTLPRALELDARRYPERFRIESLITSAASDFELWDVLEKEVFTMPARLGIVKTTEHDRKSTEPGDEDSDSDSADDSQNLSLYVHGPLYPAYLLLALRRLDTAFSGNWARVLCLGRLHTFFFNELLSIYWTRRGDLSGMLDLLEEMRHCGIYFDNETARILNQVDTTISDITKGHSGFGTALMEMPEYEPSQRLGHTSQGKIPGTRYLLPGGIKVYECIVRTNFRHLHVAHLYEAIFNIKFRP
ncbi:hypothetical protein EKO27_g11373 [Xylaria grammica]|uniref:Mtf2-like C-terminal domain-containing protein n=1 Tax=Xylaria grammica TaxID=363999 RepID=A0A439CNI8_9PEZI|nr:hypothetical protein EKO27_g11373 [Xylaria grammica]